MVSSSTSFSWRQAAVAALLFTSAVCAAHIPTRHGVARVANRFSSPTPENAKAIEEAEAAGFSKLNATALVLNGTESAALNGTQGAAGNGTAAGKGKGKKKGKGKSKGKGKGKGKDAAAKGKGKGKDGAANLNTVIEQLLAEAEAARGIVV